MGILIWLPLAVQTSRIPWYLMFMQFWGEKSIMKLLHMKWKMFIALMLRFSPRDPLWINFIYYYSFSWICLCHYACGLTFSCLAIPYYWNWSPPLLEFRRCCYVYEWHLISLHILSSTYKSLLLIAATFNGGRLRFWNALYRISW